MDRNLTVPSKGHWKKFTQQNLLKRKNWTRFQLSLLRQSSEQKKSLKNLWFTSQSSQELTQNMIQLRLSKKKVQRSTWCHLWPWMKKPLSSQLKLWLTTSVRLTFSSLQVDSQLRMSQMVQLSLLSIFCSMKKCVQLLIALSPVVAWLSVSVMASRLWSNQVFFHMGTLKMPKVLAQPSSTMMPTNTWPRW